MMKRFCRFHLRLIKNARRIWHRLWSVRLSLLAAVLAAVESVFTYWTTGHAPLIVVGAGVVSLAASISRVVAQDALHEDEATP